MKTGGEKTFFGVPVPFPTLFPEQKTTGFTFLSTLFPDKKEQRRQRCFPKDLSPPATERLHLPE